LLKFLEEEKKSEVCVTFFLFPCIIAHFLKPRKYISIQAMLKICNINVSVSMIHFAK